MRLFVNDNRVSTAVKVTSGAILQVYPAKQSFADEVAWQKHWEITLKPKIILRFSDDEDEASVAAPAPVKKPVAPTAVPVKKPAAPAAPASKKEKTLSKWTVKKLSNFSYTLPAGDYFIGDLCYVLSDKIYHKVFGGTGYSSGIYEENKTGLTFLVANTAYGDGYFSSSDGREFAVDAGIIGICPYSLMAKNDGGGHVYTFETSVTCDFNGGCFSFSWGEYASFVIDTTGDDDAY
jgi:hypothetical protein